MGNPKGLSSTIPEDVVQERWAHGEHVSPPVFFIMDREEVGHEGHNFDYVGNCGNLLDPCRPSYITNHPKSKSIGVSIQQSQAQMDDIPDLNKIMENSMDLDPFDLAEIFRLEEEENRDDEGMPGPIRGGGDYACQPGG
ncbi:hypothetical protein Hanom_Chr08g00745591 [Helianthus anomalus]